MPNTDLVMWAAIVGFLLPMVIAVVQRQHWPDGLRSVVAFVLCLAAAVPTVYLQGPEDFTWHRWITASLTILTVTIASYKGLWKPTGVAPSIEHSTDPPPRKTRR